MPYALLADVRALDGLADTTVYPDAVLTQGIDIATALIDGYCGTSFEAKAFSVTLDGNASFTILTPVLFIRSITSVTIDGVSVPAGNFLGRNEGLVVRNDGGFFTSSSYGSNVVIAGTAGVTTTPPEEIKWAARTIARQYALDTKGKIPDGAVQIQSDYGQLDFSAELVRPGPGRPTKLPSVNVVLNRHKHKPGLTGSVVS